MYELARDPDIQELLEKAIVTERAAAIAKGGAQ